MRNPLFVKEDWYTSIDNLHANLSLYVDGKTMSDHSEINLFFSKEKIPLQIKKYKLNVSQDIKESIYSDRFLTGDEYDSAIKALLPTRDDALLLLKQANLRPSFPHGGSMNTINILNGCNYPRLNQSVSSQNETVVKNLENFHCNITTDGIPCDELIYLLNGSVHFYFYTPCGIIHMDVTAAKNFGWLLVFKGSIPHCGLFSPIAKQLAVIIGPEKWKMQFATLEELQRNHKKIE